MKKIIFTAFGLVVIAGAVYASGFYNRNQSGVAPAILPPPEDIAESTNEDELQNDNSQQLEQLEQGEQNQTDFPLILPDGFSISIFAKDLPSARAIAGPDGQGNYWVSQHKEGLVSLLEVEAGQVVRQSVVSRDLNRPHGLALDPQDPLLLYIAEEDKISKVRLYSDGPLEPIIDLPTGGRHFTRTIGFGPDGRLYVSIGSACDTCFEPDEQRGTIYSMNKDGSDYKPFARGLRNAVFFTWSEIDGRMWATEMGRDFLGDDLPPDEVNIVAENGNYGWPICYGKNIVDTVFHKDDHVHIRPDCSEPFELPSHIDIPAHSAPLGLSFIPESTAWPEEYWHDLIIAYHGSWNRTEPTGYKLVRAKLDEQGNFEGFEDFITGWLTSDDRSLGRPVDMRVFPDGTMLVSDDKAGVIYKITYSE